MVIREIAEQRALRSLGPLIAALVFLVSLSHVLLELMLVHEVGGKGQLVDVQVRKEVIGPVQGGPKLDGVFEKFFLRVHIVF